MNIILRVGFVFSFLLFFGLSISAQTAAQQATEITDNMKQKTNFSQSDYDQVYQLNMTFVTAKENLGVKPKRGTAGYQTWVNNYNNLITNRKNGLSNILTEPQMNLLTKGQRQ
jgi:hypothetical protein